ncbi:MAG: hypothetical protein WAO00_19255 [Chthoniobacterales bacterium]
MKPVPLRLVFPTPPTKVTPGGLLTDRNGRFVRYEIRRNQDQYNYKVAPMRWQSIVVSKPVFRSNTATETCTQGLKPLSEVPVLYPSAGYQEFSPNASPSCMKCHSVATTTRTSTPISAFLLGNAE